MTATFGDIRAAVQSPYVELLPEQWWDVPGAREYLDDHARGAAWEVSHDKSELFVSGCVGVVRGGVIASEWAGDRCGAVLQVVVWPERLRVVRLYYEALHPQDERPHRILELWRRRLLGEEVSEATWDVVRRESLQTILTPLHMLGRPLGYRAHHAARAACCDAVRDIEQAVGRAYKGIPQRPGYEPDVGATLRNRCHARLIALATGQATIEDVLSWEVEQ